MIKLDKVKADIRSLQTMQDGHFSDWVKAPWSGHHWTDMFVESSRHAPYLMGHIWALYVPVSLIAIIWLMV